MMRWRPARLRIALVAVGCSCALVAVAFTVALGGSTRRATSKQTTPVSGGTLRAALLFTDGLSHFAKLPPGYDYFLDPQWSYEPIDWELFRCCLLRTLLSYNGRPTAQGGAELHPDLAAAMPEISRDRLAWTFHLRRGLHYAPPFAHTEIRAQDIVRALERDLTPSPHPVAAAIGSYLGAYRFYYLSVIAGAHEYAEGKADTISGLETPDDHTLVVHLLRPAGDLGYRLSLPAAAPIPPSPSDPRARLGVAKGHNAGYGRFLVASGPYMVAGSERLDFSLPASRQKPVSGYVWQSASGFVHGKSLTLVRNPSWDRSSDSLRKAYLDRIVLRIGGTPAGDAAAVDRGALDLVFDASAPVDQVQRYLADPRLKRRVFLYPSPYLFYLPMNVALPPFDDVHVRRAVNWAIDKAGLVRLANSKRFHFFGPIFATAAGHVAADSVEDELLQNYDPYATPAHAGNLQAAASEMARSRYDRNHDGMCDAKACRSVLALTDRDGALPAMAALVRKDLKPIGIDLRVRVVGNSAADLGHDAQPRDKVPLAIGEVTGADYPNGSTSFLPTFYGPELSVGASPLRDTEPVPARGHAGGAAPVGLRGEVGPERRRPDRRLPPAPRPGPDPVLGDARPVSDGERRALGPLHGRPLCLHGLGPVRNFTWDQFTTGIAALDQISLAPTG